MKVTAKAEETSESPYGSNMINAAGCYSLMAPSSSGSSKPSLGSKRMSVILPLVPFALSASVETLNKIMAFIPMAISMRSASFFRFLFFQPGNLEAHVICQKSPVAVNQILGGDYVPLVANVAAILLEAGYSALCLLPNPVGLPDPRYRSENL